MVRVLIAGLLAMVIAVALGPKFIEWLRSQGIGQQIREEGPAGHMVKPGTPTMGGLLILVAAVVPFLALSKYTIPGLTHARATSACALIGFADDYLKVQAAPVARAAGPLEDARAGRRHGRRRRAP